MLKKILLLTLSSLCYLLVGTCMAQLDGIDYNWELKRDKNDIQVFTSAVAGSKYKAVRAVSIIPGNVESFVALVLDFDACPKWADLCKTSRQVGVISATESFVYTLNVLPFPVANRDAVAFVTWQQNPKTKKVTMTSIATDSTLVKVGSAVRLEDAVVQWHFTPLAHNTVRVESFAHIDPNGPTPAWVTNQLLISSPFKSIKNMRRMIESGAYDHAQVDFLN